MNQKEQKKEWDKRFLRLAREVSSYSKDPSSKIGAVLVRDRKVVSTGYNGFPSGIADDERLQKREVKYQLIVHAEMNAVLQAGLDAKGSTLYLYGFQGAPCQNCVKHLIAAGVRRIVAAGVVPPVRWAVELWYAAETLKEAEVSLEIWYESL